MPLSRAIFLLESIVDENLLKGTIGQAFHGFSSFFFTCNRRCCGHPPTETVLGRLQSLTCCEASRSRHEGQQAPCYFRATKGLITSKIKISAKFDWFIFLGHWRIFNWLWHWSSKVWKLEVPSVLSFSLPLSISSKKKDVFSHPFFAPQRPEPSSCTADDMVDTVEDVSGEASATCSLKESRLGERKPNGNQTGTKWVPNGLLPFLGQKAILPTPLVCFIVVFWMRKCPSSMLLTHTLFKSSCYGYSLTINRGPSWEEKESQHQLNPVVGCSPHASVLG